MKNESIEHLVGVKELPVSVLKLLLECDPENGTLTFKNRESWMFPTNNRLAQWNGRYAGELALNDLGNHGYLCGDIMGKKNLAHRTIWAMHYGEWPCSQVDHINMIVTDNRISNLRDVTQSPNQWNRTKYANNTSGFKGVSYYKRNGSWRAQITYKGAKKTIGYFSTPEDAANAYDVYCDKMHGEYARTNEKAPD